MRYDTVIIGGGLAALICGIELARNGKRTAIVATGHSTLHMFPGAFSLLGKDANGKEVDSAAEAVESYNAAHPYRIIGDDFTTAAIKATEVLALAGISTNGSYKRNHYFITPTGSAKSCFLSIEGMAVCEQKDSFGYSSAAIFNADGFLDFYPQFIAEALQNMGCSSTLHSFSLPELAIRRNNPTEMRSTNIARALDKQDNILALASIISREAGEAEVVIMPAVMGFERTDVQATLERLTGKKILTIPTLPPSVEGIKVERQLRRTFEAAGGVLFAGHTAESFTAEQGVITSITTSKQVTITADNFVLASGSFIGGGLTSDRQGIEEPLFGADIVPAIGSDYTASNLFEPQPFMSCGISTDEQFRVKKQGTAIENLYACGAILASTNPVKEGSGTGVAMLTAITVAEAIINR